MQALGSMAEGLGFRGPGEREGAGCRVKGVGYRMKGVRYTVWGLGCRVQGCTWLGERDARSHGGARGGSFGHVPHLAWGFGFRV